MFNMFLLIIDGGQAVFLEENIVAEN